MVAVATAGPAAAGQQGAASRTMTVAAASDLQEVFPELKARFERGSGATVIVSFGSSGNLLAQISNGAPFDVFLSADVEYPRQLVKAGLAEKDSLYEYASGRLVLWTRHETRIDVHRGLKGLTDQRVRRIAIANPEHAPYGRAAVAAMQHAQVYEAVKGKLVLAENVAQAAQLADSGNADVGIVSLSLASGKALGAGGVYAEVPENAHPPIRQAAVVVSASRAKAAARTFVDSLKGAEAISVLRRFGFSAPR
jgi:molybdate transport system substrate-binding protein